MAPSPSSALSVGRPSLLGSETPRIFTPPLRLLTPKTSAGFVFITFARDVVGIELLPWQQWLAIHALELLPDGSFRFRTVLLLVARQNGKSTFLQILALFFMFVRGVQLVIGTAQNLDVAEELWQGAVDIAQQVPELAAEIDRVVMTNGKRALELRQGERYKVQSANRRGGRGLAGDLILMDELREHQNWHGWAAVSHTTMARATAQIWGASNAGDGFSVVLSSLRRTAHAALGDPDGIGLADAEAGSEDDDSLAIFEWSAPPDADMDDRGAWAQANPSLGHTITERAIVSARNTDPAPVFSVEVLCRWVTTVDPAIPAATWNVLADPDAPRGTPVTFGLDVAPDQSSATIAVAWRRADGAAHVMLAEHRTGVDWAAARCRELLTQWGGRLVVEQTGTAAFLLPDLEGLAVEKVARRFYVDGCSTLDAAITARQVRHGAEPALDDAVAVAKWTTYGETGQRVLGRKDPRVSPLAAGILALHGLAALPAPRKPSRLIVFQSF